MLTACNGPSSTEPATTAWQSVPVPATAGSMAPNLENGPNGELVLSWLEPTDTGHRLRFSSWIGGEWSAATTVSSGDHWFINWADFPSVLPVSDDLWAAHWLASQPEGGYAYDVKVSLSADKGETWSDAIIPHADGTATEHGFVTLFPSGDDVGLVWLDGRKMINEFDINDVTASGMTLRAATLDSSGRITNDTQLDDLTCDCCQTDVAQSNQHTLAVFRDRSTDEIRDIQAVRHDGSEWTGPSAVSKDNWEIAACPVNGPVVEAQGSQVAVAWFTAANDKPLVKVSWSKNSGKSFAAPTIVSEDRARGHVGAAMLDNDTVVVSWLRALDQGKAELVLRRVSRNGDLSDEISITQSVDIAARSVPQLARVNDRIVVAWTSLNNETMTIASASIRIDAI